MSFMCLWFVKTVLLPPNKYEGWVFFVKIQIYCGRDTKSFIEGGSNKHWRYLWQRQFRDTFIVGAFKLYNLNTFWQESSIAIRIELDAKSGHLLAV